MGSAGIHKTERFKLEREPTAAGEKEATQGRLHVDGRPTDRRLEGVLLEGAYHLPGPRLDLLLVTEDCPYEETLHIYLLDERQTVLEASKLGGAYTPGLLSDVAVAGENELTFAFQGRHRLIVHPRPQGLLRRRRLELRSAPEATGNRGG